MRHRIKTKDFEEAYLACCCLSLVDLAPKRNTLVSKPELRPAYCESVQLLKAAAFETMADDGDARRIRARELAEAGDGEEYVLERVERRVLDGHSRKQIRRR
jgi:hypothetical protein